MEGIEQAIMHAAQAGKLRSYVRKNGETGLAGLMRLADRHSALSAEKLERAGASMASAGTPLRAPAMPVGDAREGIGF